ncbi:Calpain-7-like protein [Papilio machaon]|uniref:Calpain-7-like protein n=1 Tax=Papilio machaon TaxID=76193 RepID=A0A194QXQ0_PAPMA|nr:Calpain-7-like protein [Papilio machaon]
MKKTDATKSVLDINSGHTDCPFREFRDSELSVDSWGLGPLDYKSTLRLAKGVSKTHTEHVWVDSQIQPLPRSVMKRLHGWVRAEDLAQTLWEAEVTIFDDNNGGSMSVSDIQFAYYPVLQMSSFCRKVLSYCYILERAEDFTVEHQWENFVFSIPPEGWRARYHIYSPGLKYGGGQQHRPTLSKNGCYLVRLYYIGAWRCVWVSDQIPVDAMDCPLLPFAPFFSQNAKQSTQTKPPVPFMSNPTVHLWPLLLCKALLKLAAPSMEDVDSPLTEDQVLAEFDILHALTGALNLTYNYDDTREFPPYYLPGITPAFEMSLLVTMARDLPIKKPLPEPEVAQWKHYRWVDWARNHGLYEAYDCPRTKFVKLNGLLKLSQAPHLLDVQSTDSITFGFREEQARTNPAIRKAGKEVTRSFTNHTMSPQLKEELREWVKFDMIMNVLKNISILCYPSMFQLSSIASNPPIRITKAPPNKQLDIPASKTSPLYLQIDGPEQNVLKVSCGMLHPRVFLHAGLPIDCYVEPGYVLIEKFKWFEDCELPKPKVYLQTRGYDATEVSFEPGRHFCRLWVHSRVPWHVMTMSESTICVGTRDVIQAAAVRECPWASRFLSALGLAFQNFVRISKSATVLNTSDKDFYRSYQPDLDWNIQEVGYDKRLLHWMFRQALQSTLKKKLAPYEYRLVCIFLQRYLKDPDFGLSKDIIPYVSSTHWLANDPCDCMPETEELVLYRFQYTEITPEDIGTESFRQTICETAEETLSCGHLKTIREMKIRRHEAAKKIQALWRGFRTRKIIDARETVTPEIMKYLMDNAFGNLEALSGLMNEFFIMFPGTKNAYSVASALTGTFGLKQHTGSSHVSPKCVWIPFFQVVFYCHGPVKIHFDLQSVIGTIKINSIIEVYNNDTKTLLPQAYNTHFTYNFNPNIKGYTIIGHGSLKQSLNINTEAHWQLNVMSNIANIFHVCDNDVDGCKEQSVPSATKVHIEEIYLPNQRNILGGLQISVHKQETICFRASVTSPDLEIVAILRTKTRSGQTEEVARYTGRGELYWPYIRLQGEQRPTHKTTLLTNTQSFQSSLKEKRDSPRVNDPLHGDAYVEMECSLTAESGATACRDDSRELEFIAIARSWDAKDPGRNLRGAKIRKEFREEYLDLPTPPVTEIVEGKFNEVIISVRVGLKKDEHKTSSKSLEVKDGAKYLTMPDVLKDKFKPLDFIPLCTREQTEEESIVITPEMTEASRRARDAQMVAAIERMNQLQAYYEANILEVQKTRCDILEKLFVDSQWTQGLSEALEARDLTLTTVESNKNASLTRRKHESKTK